MSRRLVPPLVACAAIAAGLVLVACGGDEGGSSDKVGDVNGIQADCGNIEYHGSGTPAKLIVSDLPLKGDSAERSKQQNDAIVQELARKGWQAGNDIQVAFQACDDSIASTGEWDESLCRTNAQRYAANPDVIGVIGTYNSGCAAIEMPILNKAPGGGVRWSRRQHLRLPDGAQPDPLQAGRARQVLPLWHPQLHPRGPE